MDQRIEAARDVIYRVTPYPWDVSESLARQVVNAIAAKVVTPDRWPDANMLEAAWGIIANAFEGDWESAPENWRLAAEQWRDAYHRTLSENGSQEAGQ